MLLHDPIVEDLGTSDFTNDGKRKSRKPFPINRGLRGGHQESTEQFPKVRQSHLQSPKEKGEFLPRSNISPEVGRESLNRSWLDVVLRE